MTESRKEPWWKNGWVLGLAVLGLLHVTGMAVHVQAGLQRILLETGLFHPQVIAVESRVPAATSFRYAGPDGGTRALADSDGRVRFVNFWATWCAPCLAEMPAISRLHADYADRVEFVMVSLDEDPDQASAYVDRAGFGFDPVRPASPVPSSLTSGVIPTTVVIDRSGRIAVREDGMADYDSRKFRLALDRLLSED